MTWLAQRRQGCLDCCSNYRKKGLLLCFGSRVVALLAGSFFIWIKSAGEA